MASASESVTKEPILSNDACSLNERNDRQEAAINAPGQGSVFMKLLLHSLAMFSLPFCVYYYIRNYVEKEWDLEAPQSYIYGTIGAVIIVHIIIVSYVYQAFKEEKFFKQMKEKLS